MLLCVFKQGKENQIALMVLMYQIVLYNKACLLCHLSLVLVLLNDWIAYE